MDTTRTPSELLENIDCPAFLTESGIITHTNTAASLRQLTNGTKVAPLIVSGQKEYEDFSSGKLCLTLRTCETNCAATVTVCDGYHLFRLESDYEDPELRAFALAAQHLREPLSAALLCADTLRNSDTLDMSTEESLKLARINQSLYQLHRIVCNMSDAAQLESKRFSKTEFRDAVSIIDSIVEKSQSFAAQFGVTIEYRTLPTPVNTLIDEEKLERAIMNLISNAVKFSPNPHAVYIELRSSKERLYISVENRSDSMTPQIRSSVFSRFLREPGIESAQSGIGLGLTVVRKAAAAHGGALLMESAPEGEIRFTLTIAVTRPTPGSFHEPTIRPGDYAGGYDHALLELSDLLPPECYQ